MLKLSDTCSLLQVDPIPFVCGLSYTPQTIIAERWKLPLTITIKSSTELELSIPAFVPTSFISAPILTICGMYYHCSKLHTGSRNKQPIDLKNNEHSFFKYTRNSSGIENLVAAMPGSDSCNGGCPQLPAGKRAYTERPGFIHASIVDAKYC
jgi:hypothetical protein